MGSTVRLQSRPARMLGGFMVVVSAIGLLSVAVDGLDVLLRYGAPVALLGLLGWGAFWNPYVEVSDGGVTLANTLRTVVVPWPAVEGVDGRYGLRLQTAYGPVTAWAAQAPAGRQRARGQRSEAAALVEERLESLRAAGYLEDRRLERPQPAITWHRGVVAAIAALGVASVALPLLV